MHIKGGTHRFVEESGISSRCTLSVSGILPPVRWREIAHTRQNKRGPAPSIRTAVGGSWPGMLHRLWSSQVATRGVANVILSFRTSQPFKEFFALPCCSITAANARRKG